MRDRRYLALSIVLLSSVFASTALAGPRDPQETLAIAGGGFLVGLIVGTFAVGFVLALLRRVLSVARRIVVAAITASVVIAIAAGFAIGALSLFP